MKAGLRNTKAATLTPGQVIALREQYAKGVTQRELCEIYNISIGQVGRIVRNESWRHLVATPADERQLREMGERLMAVQKMEGEVKNTVETSPEFMMEEMFKEKHERAMSALDEYVAKGTEGLKEKLDGQQGGKDDAGYSEE